MNSSLKMNKRKKLGSKGSSLVIALIFFMVCALLCASVLYLSNSTNRGVSKSLSIAETETFVPPPTPTPRPTPTPTPTPDPVYEAETAAIDIIYANLNYSFYNACLDADKSITTSFYNNPQNMTYEILSYVHSNYSNAKVPVSTDNDGTISVLFTYQINSIPVEVLFEMSGTNGSKPNNGLRFHYLKITVRVPESTGCTYSQVVEYTVNNGKDGKFYFRWSGSGGKHFDLKNE